MGRLTTRARPEGWAVPRRLPGKPSERLDRRGDFTSNPRPRACQPPGRPTKPRAQVAQLVEQRTENPRVGGSIPPLGTTSPLDLLNSFIFFAPIV